jgi:hypothetical protein
MVQEEFFILQRCNLEKVKNNAFQDMSHELSNRRYKVKAKLQIRGMWEFSFHVHSGNGLGNFFWNPK